jgi:NACalpha-BTF3-like transcription factor
VFTKNILTSTLLLTEPASNTIAATATEGARVESVPNADFSDEGKRTGTDADDEDVEVADEDHNERIATAEAMDLAITEANTIRQIMETAGCEREEAIEALKNSGGDSTAAVEWIMQGFLSPTFVVDFEVID